MRKHQSDESLPAPVSLTADQLTQVSGALALLPAFSAIPRIWIVAGNIGGPVVITKPVVAF